MSPDTSGAGPSHEAIELEDLPSSAGPSNIPTITVNEDPIAEAPPAGPSMEMRPPVRKPNLGPNVTAHAIQTENGTQYIYVSHEVPSIPLRARIEVGIRNCADDALNCCLACICKICCGI